MTQHNAFAPQESLMEAHKYFPYISVADLSDRCEKCMQSDYSLLTPRVWMLNDDSTATHSIVPQRSSKNLAANELILL